MQFSTLLAFALASIGVSHVTALTLDSEHIPVNYDTYIAELNDASSGSALVKRAGCGSSGPLGTGHYEWYITVGCTPGDV